MHQVRQARDGLGLVRQGVLSAWPKQAAGILLYRRGPRGLEVLLAHPGGPLWARKDLGAWTLPKGQFTDDERPIAAAKREFEEEMGSPPTGEFVEIGSIKQPSGKVVHAFVAESDFDVVDGAEQPVLAGVAAEIRAARAVSGSRSRGVVLDRRGATENIEGPAAVFGSAPGPVESVTRG